MFAKSIAIALLLVTFAEAVTYPIVAVRAPRWEDRIASWQQVKDPIDGEPGSSLVIIPPDGGEDKVLVDAGPDGMCLDPCVSLDGEWVFYSFVANQRVVNTQIRAHAAYSGADLFKINVSTGEKIQLTHQEWTPAMGVANWVGETSGNLKPLGHGAVDGESWLGYGIYNTGPCEVPGGRLIFTSSRNGYIAPKSATFPNLQLFAMDLDGKNVEEIGFLNVGGALHPQLLKNGDIMWSSWESQGIRNPLLWGLWSSKPDGREWGPLFSAFTKTFSAHFQTQQPDGKIAFCLYYIQNNQGFGTIFRFPHNPQMPAELHAFHSPLWNLNPQQRKAYGSTFANFVTSSYTPWGLEIATSFCNEYDFPASPHNVSGAERFGKVTQPSAGPDGLLMVYSPGPVNSAQPPFTPHIQGKIAVLPYDKTAVEHPSALTIIREDPRYNYQQPRALLSWKQIYGVDPVQVSWNPNDGIVHPKLPKGTPFGIVGTSSVYNRNSVTNGDTRDGYNTIGFQGGDIGTYANADIHAIRILQTIPQSHRGATRQQAGFHPPHQLTVGWRQAGGQGLPNERLKIIGDIPLRKFDAAGKPILDSKGDPDTSFQVRIPADVPYTFALLDKKGKTLCISQTWHQLRPGERRVNCGGCHGHSEDPVDFDFTEAAKSNYVIADLLGKPRDVEWHRDVKTVVEAECKNCHTTNPVAKAKMDLTDTLVGFASKSMSLQARVSPVVLAAEGASPHQAIAEAKVKTIVEWIDLGMGVDEGKYFQDNINPTLTVASPARDEVANVIVIGAYDNESGLDMPSFSVKLDGQEIGGRFTGGTGFVWTAALPTVKNSGAIVVSVKDKQGNQATVNRSFNGTAPSPGPDPDGCEELEGQIALLQAQLENVRVKAEATTEAAQQTEAAAAEKTPAAAAEYLGRDADRLGDLRSKVPDGKPDHHIRLTGLRHPIEHINIHADAIKWSDMAGEESPEFPQGKWWWVMREPRADGAYDIYFSDRGTTGNFIVFPIYADGSFDRLEVEAGQ